MVHQLGRRLPHELERVDMGPGYLSSRLAPLKPLLAYAGRRPSWLP